MGHGRHGPIETGTCTHFPRYLETPGIGNVSNGCNLRTPETSHNLKPSMNRNHPQLNTSVYLRLSVVFETVKHHKRKQQQTGISRKMDAIDEYNPPKPWMHVDQTSSYKNIKFHIFGLRWTRRRPHQRPECFGRTPRGVAVARTARCAVPSW